LQLKATPGTAHFSYAEPLPAKTEGKTNMFHVLDDKTTMGLGSPRLEEASLYVFKLLMVFLSGAKASS
jgi:hypothetical protein